MSAYVDHADLLALPGHKVQLSRFDPKYTCNFRNKDHAKVKLRADVKQLSALQDTFYADGRYALLIIFQGMDAAGKDGAIKHVMSGVNPQGVDVHSFKQPSAEELSHDYLWRCAKVLPERGRIGIFNRSYYEEVGIVRVHSALLEHERLPPQIPDTGIWEDRFADIAAFEQHLFRNGTIVLKFFLHISKNEQRKRLLERIDKRQNNWKMSASDIAERSFWDSYQSAYEKMLANTSTSSAPWYIIPSDHKWFTRVAVADVIVTRMMALGLTYPQVGEAQRAQLAADRKQLVGQSGSLEIDANAQPHESALRT